MEGILFSVLLVIPSSLQGADLKTKLRLTPETLAIGLSPSVSIEVTSISGRPQRVSHSATLLVSPADGSDPSSRESIRPIRSGTTMSARSGT